LVGFVAVVDLIATITIAAPADQFDVIE